MADTYTWYITGTSRGLGLELVRQLVSSEYPYNFVIAACRNPSSATELNALTPTKGNTLHVVQLDVCDEVSIQASASETEQLLQDKGLDYLVNNAAVSGGTDTLSNLSIPWFKKTFDTNVLGPALVTRTFLHLVEKSQRKVVLNMSSGLGSIALDYGQEYASYSPCKTALNMLTYKQAKARPDLIFLTMCPGWCKTEMGGEGAEIEPSDSMAGAIRLLQNATLEHSGRYWRYTGVELPW
ncbi:C-factor [Panus rudis PR-1116 ss-1]|nr:C-factor [Panus rudis PR-1116 ss-1]